MSDSKIVLQIGGSREGRDYRFIADGETLKRIANQLLDCVERGKAGPWGPKSSVVLCETIRWERQGLFKSFSEAAFISFEAKYQTPNQSPYPTRAAGPRG
jgi:hypothetical protein